MYPSSDRDTAAGSPLTIACQRGYQFCRIVAVSPSLMPAAITSLADIAKLPAFTSPNVTTVVGSRTRNTL
jgi:hypothetical protein